MDVFIKVKINSSDKEYSQNRFVDESINQIIFRFKKKYMYIEEYSKNDTYYSLPTEVLKYPKPGM